MSEAMNGVKQEDGLAVKDEPVDMATPMSSMSEEVEEEDTGELSMPKDASDEGSYPGIFLTRVPKDLYNGVNTAVKRQDEPQRIGTVRVWNLPDGKQEMRVYFNRDCPGLQMVAKDYEFDVTNMNPINTYIFTEKDLPGYRPGAWNHRSARNDRVQKVGGGNNRHMRGRRSIPKKTALVGFSKHEFSLHPLETEEYYRIEKMKDRANAEADAKSTTQTFKSVATDAEGRPGVNLWGKFTQPVPPPGARVNRQLHKAERLPQNELIDKLVDCFRRYAYWHFKTLVREVQQPEAYVKETLSKIAVLVKSGTYANTYMLSQQYRDMDAMNVQEAAEQAAPQLAGDDIESDTEMKMEGENEGEETRVSNMEDAP